VKFASITIRIFAIVTVEIFLFLTVLAIAHLLWYFPRDMGLFSLLFMTAQAAFLLSAVWLAMEVVNVVGLARIHRTAIMRRSLAINFCSLMLGLYIGGSIFIPVYMLVFLILEVAIRATRYSVGDTPFFKSRFGQILP
jgi:hypothetical protein